jgi:hypothetical protein
VVCIYDCEHNEQRLGKEHLNPDIRFKQLSCNSAKNCIRNEDIEQAVLTFGIAEINLPGSYS